MLPVGEVTVVWPELHGPAQVTLLNTAEKRPLVGLKPVVAFIV